MESLSLHKSHISNLLAPVPPQTTPTPTPAIAIFHRAVPAAPVAPRTQMHKSPMLPHDSQSSLSCGTTLGEQAHMESIARSRLPTFPSAPMHYSPVSHPANVDIRTSTLAYHAPSSCFPAYPLLPQVSRHQAQNTLPTALGQLQVTEGSSEEKRSSPPSSKQSVVYDADQSALNSSDISVKKIKPHVQKRNRSDSLAGDKSSTYPLPVKKHARKSASSTPAVQKKVRSSKSNIPGTSRYWTPSEHKLFVLALLKYGPKDLKSIAAYVGTRNMIQCRTHEQKCFMRLMREAQRETELRSSSRQVQGRRSTSSLHVDGSDTVDDEMSGASSACGVRRTPFGGDMVTGVASSASSSMTSEIPERGRPSADEMEECAESDMAAKQAKDVYSVPSSCGITLLCVVGEEMSRALSC